MEKEMSMGHMYCLTREAVPICVALTHTRTHRHRGDYCCYKESHASIVTMATAHLQISGLELELSGTLDEVKVGDTDSPLFPHCANKTNTGNVIRSIPWIVSGLDSLHIP